jgi:preprotein translocase subunit SecD
MRRLDRLPRLTHKVMSTMQSFLSLVFPAALLVLCGGVSGCGGHDLKPNSGTRLVYEVDDELRPENYSLDDLAAAVKRRIEPVEREAILVKPIGKNRVEISVPRGPDHAARLQQIKDLLATTGSLEFRIVANPSDDKTGIDAARAYFVRARTDANAKDELERLAGKGSPPAPVRPANGETWPNGCTYSWFELGRAERAALKLNNTAAENPDPQTLWNKAAEARQNGTILPVPGLFCLFSRPCQNRLLPAAERDRKQWEYFVLCRDPEKAPQTGAPMRITGMHITQARASSDAAGRPAVAFHLNEQGGKWFLDLTSRNKPSGTSENTFRRRLAIILDGQVLTEAPLDAPIGQDGIITGNFAQQDVDDLVTFLRAGALPAPLKPVPVVEEEIKPEKD